MTPPRILPHWKVILGTPRLSWTCRQFKSVMYTGAPLSPSTVASLSWIVLLEHKTHAVFALCPQIGRRAGALPQPHTYECKGFSVCTEKPAVWPVASSYGDVKNGSYTLRSVILLPRLSTTGGFSHNKISPIWVLSDFTALSPTVTCNKCVLVQRWNPCRSVQHVQEYMMLLCILNHEVDHFLDNFIIHCIFACIYVRPSTKGDGNSYSQDAHCCTTSTYFRQIFFIVPGWKLLIF